MLPMLLLLLLLLRRRGKIPCRRRARGGHPGGRSSCRKQPRRRRRERGTGQPRRRRRERGTGPAASAAAAVAGGRRRTATSTTRVGGRGPWRCSSCTKAVTTLASARRYARGHRSGQVQTGPPDERGPLKQPRAAKRYRYTLKRRGRRSASSHDVFFL